MSTVCLDACLVIVGVVVVAVFGGGVAVGVAVVVDSI